MTSVGLVFPDAEGLLFFHFGFSLTDVEWISRIQDRIDNHAMEYGIELTLFYNSHLLQLL
jgi:hypothetical protein